LALNGKHLAPEFGNWKLGLGPQAHDREIDKKIEYLPGAWSVRVDERCRIVGCELTLEKPPHHSPTVFKVRRDRIMALSATVVSPRAAAADARACMRNHLNLPVGRQR
jgi:hypothetical protein